jgi:molecular chaperone GrpE
MVKTVSEEEKTGQKLDKEADRRDGEVEGSEEREMGDPSLEKMTRPQLLMKMEELKQQAEKNYDLYVRSQADLENAKKRFTKEKAEFIRFSNESLIKQLLPVLDNLESAVAHARMNSSREDLMKGVELTLKGLKDTLMKAGLKEIPCVGESFDPCYHEATLRKPDTTVKPGTVVEEYQKGYLLNERLIRPSMVAVSGGES